MRRHDCRFLWHNRGYRTFDDFLATFRADKRKKAKRERRKVEESGIAFNLRPIPEADVLSADEIMLSSATKEVLPVTTLDGEAVGHGALRGKPGPVYAKLFEAYQRAKVTQSI